MSDTISKIKELEKMIEDGISPVVQGPHLQMTPLELGEESKNRLSSIPVIASTRGDMLRVLSVTHKQTIADSMINSTKSLDRHVAAFDLAVSKLLYTGTVESHLGLPSSLKLAITDLSQPTHLFYLFHSTHSAEHINSLLGEELVHTDEGSIDFNKEAWANFISDNEILPESIPSP